MSRSKLGAMALLPTAVQPCLPWDRHELRSIELPTGVSVPEGALQKGRSDRSLLMRSTCEVPLADQVTTLTTIAGFVAPQLDEGGPYLQACFDLGWLLESHHRLNPMRHPANLLALAMAGTLVHSQRGALLLDATLEFCKWKQNVLRALRGRFGESVYIPDFFEDHEFDVASEQREALVRAVNVKLRAIKDFVCESLNVTRLPVRRGGSWYVALLPNMVGASDADVAAGVGTFYELLKLREEQHRRGDELTADDVANLAATLRGAVGG